MAKDFAAAAERLVALYNAKDLATMESLVAVDLDFAHFNRDFKFAGRAGLFEVLRQFAAALVPDRKFLPADRVSVCGNIVIREGFYTGTAQVDLPGFAQAGGSISFEILHRDAFRR